MGDRQLNKDQRFEMVGKVVVRRIGTDILLVPVSGPAATGQVYPVNGTAECIWNCLSTGGTLQQAADNLCEQFEIEADTALADCEDCAQSLIEQQLIVEVKS